MLYEVLSGDLRCTVEASNPIEAFGRACVEAQPDCLGKLVAIRAGGRRGARYYETESLIALSGVQLVDWVAKP